MMHYTCHETFRVVLKLLEYIVLHTFLCAGRKLSYNFTKKYISLSPLKYASFSNKLTLKGPEKNKPPSGGGGA